MFFILMGKINKSDNRPRTKGNFIFTPVLLIRIRSDLDLFGRIQTLFLINDPTVYLLFGVCKSHKYLRIFVASFFLVHEYWYTVLFKADFRKKFGQKII
jgi:hypothetical protein